MLGPCKDGKQESVRYIKNKYPEVDLTPGRMVKPSDGIADAICIAEYGLQLTMNR